MKKKICLMGYMASGKSTVAKRLSAVTRLQFTDLDTYIEEREKLSVSQIFKEKGEIYFRGKETEYLNDFFDQHDNFILSVGGGTPCYSNNIEIINQHTISIYLKAAVQTLYKRLKSEKEKRPLVKGLGNEQLKEFIAKHLFERRNFYEQAKFTIETDKKSLEEITEEILNLI